MLKRNVPFDIIIIIGVKCMKCNNCGTFIEDNNICPNCSNAVQSSTINNSQQLIINQNEEIEFLDLCEKKEEKPIVKNEKETKRPRHCWP